MAFRRHDGDGERRSTTQQGADAFEAIFDAALRTGAAPTQHGVRPHVLVTVTWAELVAQAGVAELGFTGPASLAELRPLLSDCDLARIILGPDSVPIEVSRRTRNVPAGLWAALIARDGGCAWPGCDAPPAWCQAAHGNTPYRHDGKLKLADAALLCLRHHRRFDNDGWTLHIEGTTVTFHPTPRPAWHLSSSRPVVARCNGPRRRGWCELLRRLSCVSRAEPRFPHRSNSHTDG
jgi:hypothetical protein